MIAVGIDPGQRTSGIVALDTRFCVAAPIFLDGHDAATDEVVRDIIARADVVICEWVTSYGSVAGATVYDTARAAGRYEWMAYLHGVPFHLITRPRVALALCQRASATDAQLNEAIRQIYRDSGVDLGGGADPVRGTKVRPGPLYRLKGQHMRSAMAVAMAWLVEHGRE